MKKDAYYINNIFCFSLLFYIITYPYDFKLERKLKRVTGFKEVSYISKKEKILKDMILMR